MDWKVPITQVDSEVELWKRKYQVLKRKCDEFEQVRSSCYICCRSIRNRPRSVHAMHCFNIGVCVALNLQLNEALFAKAKRIRVMIEKVEAEKRFVHI